MNNLKLFGIPYFPLVGGIGDGGPMDEFHRVYREKRVTTQYNELYWVVGRRDGGKGCWSVRPVSGGTWDVGCWGDATPQQLVSHLRGESVLGPEHRYNVIYFSVPPGMKYIAIGLLEHMPRPGLE